MKAFEAQVLRPRVAKSQAFLAEIVIDRDVMYAVGGTNREPTLIASSDGVHFYKRKTPETPGLRSLLVLEDGAHVVCGEYGALHVSRDRGASWEAIDTGSKACLFALARDARGALWVAGDDGVVLRSEDGGTEWDTVEIGTDARITNVYADGDTVYFACFDGALVAWKDDAARVLFTARRAITDLQRTKHGLFVVGDGGQLRVSFDGEHFDDIEAVGPGVDLEAITEGPAGIFLVGARGTILRSKDGQEFSLIDSGVRDHLFSVTATGNGVFVGGEGGLLLHVRPEDDATWADRKDTLAEESGELDSLFLETSPETFLEHGLPRLVGEPAASARPWEKDFEAVWGVPIPDEVSLFLRHVADHGEALGAALYEWRPEQDLLPNLPPEENLFEWVVLRDQENYLGTRLVEAFAAQICVGSYLNGDTHMASVYANATMGTDAPLTSRDDRFLHIFNHDEHSIDAATAKSVSRFVYFSTLCRAIHDQKLSDTAMKAALERVRPDVTASWHFESTIEEAGVDPFQGFEDQPPIARSWYARALWLLHLLKSDGIVDMSGIKSLFFVPHNPPLEGEVHARWTKSARRYVPTALYCILRGFYFEDPTLDEYLAIGRAHPSRLVRDCASVVDSLRDGTRKSLGKIEDVLAQRTAFQKLDLDPRREPARKAEAVERAAELERKRVRALERAKQLDDPSAAAWNALDDAPLHEAIEKHLREEPSLAETFAAIDFVIAQKFVRENLVLAHEQGEELEWLGLHGDVRVVPLLLGRLVRNEPGEPLAEGDAPAIVKAYPASIGMLVVAFAERERLDRRAVAPLRALLGVEEKYNFCRTIAVRTLGLLRDAESREPIEKLAAGLPSNDFAEVVARKELAKAIPPGLARIGDPRAVPTLKAMLAAPDDVSKEARSFTAVALGEFGAVECWSEILALAATVDRKPAAWLLWAVGMLGAKADAAMKPKVAHAVRGFAPKWRSAYVDLVKAGVLARLGEGPNDLGAQLEKAFTTSAYDAETTALQQTWALRVLGVTDANAEPAKAFLFRDDPMLRQAAREALARRGLPVPPARLLHRAEVARLDGPALLAALEDETAVYRHVAAARIGALKLRNARDALVRYARAQFADTPREVGGKMARDEGYPLRWTLRALLDLGPSPELTSLLAELLVHPSRDVKDPALRYAEEFLGDPGLIEPMLQVAEEKWGWQESTATRWLEDARTRHPAAYQEALDRLRRPS